MGGRALAEGKENEVRELARKYGVERYLKTEKLAIIDALVMTWADGVEEDDPLSRSTKWLETKSEIEDIMAHTALENNSRETMYLLGATATGQISFEEVRAAYSDGYNTLMRQYSNTIGNMGPQITTEIERMRDRFFVTMPMFGTIEEKRAVEQQARESLANLESYLQSLHKDNLVSNTKMQLGERETTRSMLLTQAEAGFRSGALTPTDYQQIQNLIGRSQSLFQGQIKSIGQYGNNPSALLSEIDRVLSRANDVLGKQEQRYALAGVSDLSPEMKSLRQARARLGYTGDGLRAVSREQKILQTIPKVVGESVANGIGTNPPWVGIPHNLRQMPEPTVVVNPEAKHIKFMNPADVYRNDPLESRFSTYHKQKLQMPKPRNRSFGAQTPYGESPAITAKNNGLRGTAAADKLFHPAVQFGIVAVGLLATPGIIRAIRSGSSKKTTPSPADELLQQWQNE